ncbi:MAG: hypothetical protein GXP24_01170 [Planctomycetes bacterium]|nr:hypothetical protein [Planctomycetota bacterium]
MTLREQILSQLPGMIAKQHEHMTATVGPRTVRCEVDTCDQLAVTIYELVLETSELASVEIAKLQAASKSLCERVTYLLEPISPIESDADGCVVQMRSSPPQQKENGRFYYEIFLRRGGSVALHRYEKQPGSIRQRVAATLTHEVLGRLVEDFDQTVEDTILT